MTSHIEIIGEQGACPSIFVSVTVDHYTVGHTNCTLVGFQ